MYLENDGYSSVVVEILERVERASDEEALQHHFADLTDGTGDRTSVLGIEGVGVARVAYVFFFFPFSIRPFIACVTVCYSFLQWPSRVAR